MTPVELPVGGLPRSRGAVPYVRPRADAHPATRPPTRAGPNRADHHRAAPPPPEPRRTWSAGPAVHHALLHHPATTAVLVDAARPHWNHRKATA
ncbi:hypothetical protein ACIQVL_32915 [Streptomyces sp. NPDC090499]|uniref:hypothetical protein n=1 Tax=unclassified Streptomyces TaxID=2593676 RepID=UPI0037F75C3E